LTPGANPRKLKAMRRLAVGLALVLCASTAFAGKHRKRPPAAPAEAAEPAEPPPPPVELVSINTKEHYLLQPDANGSLTKKALRAFNRFMRCWHTGRTHAMNPRLAKLLYEIGRHYEKTLIVYDGYRAPKVARQKGNTKSPHKKGVACDFKLQLDVDDEKAQRESLKELRDYLYTSFDGVGVGYYPNSTFVHLDVRGKGKAFWVDYSYPGQKQSKSFYAKKTWDQLKADEAAMAAGLAPPPEPSPNPGEGGGEPQGAEKPGAPTPTAPAINLGSPENH
jgi:uncharacterized protein YcbK (DUF882 family)